MLALQISSQPTWVSFADETKTQQFSTPTQLLQGYSHKTEERLEQVQRDFKQGTDTWKHKFLGLWA